MKIVIFFSFVFFSILGIQAKDHPTALKDKILIYNQNTLDLRYCFDRIPDVKSKNIIKQIIEGEKLTVLSPILDQKDDYQIVDNNLNIRFDKNVLKTNRFIFKNFQITLPSTFNAEIIKNNLEKVESNKSLSNRATLYITCFLNAGKNIPSVTELKSDPIDKKIHEYNKNIQNPKYFSDKIKDPEDKKVYENLLATSNIGALPPIEKKGNLYQMKHNGITLEFDQDLIKQGKVRINNEIIDLSNAQNAQELTEMVQKAFKK
ncbi:MAG: hypothetical protein A2381_19520 [Bdellovibrionales bacterium RIFOXYB1_FULL_37_110]|nr:MAG: hypothetical protein A2417_11020 [Bdellovibrionales bacterium RIFOXYC1_FULL_37_79]OFZ60670.1 MAG: hypothetical protein A2381_19520 [Bdellovibrionales bacterium RIFOXYB1_FULL_37_110]OFZ64422.1 MAG: hypothetical protein A2577_10170 [Bdellovibrionales bacterium RIFOXYD1_FULL_36_51]